MFVREALVTLTSPFGEAEQLLYIIIKKIKKLQFNKSIVNIIVTDFVTFHTSFTLILSARMLVQL